MSGSRPQRAVTKGIDYREPGDDPELSESEESLPGASSEAHHSGYESALDYTFVENAPESEESCCLILL